MDEKELREIVRKVAEETRGNIVVSDFAISVARRAVEIEREACAKVCESLFDMNDDSCDEAEKCAAAIRMRSNY